MLLLLTLTLLHSALCLPPPTPDELTHYRPLVGHIDKSFDATIRFRPRSDETLAVEHDFRYVYLSQDGDQYPLPGDDLLEISITETVDNLTIATALKTISLQCANMPEAVWKKLCKNGAVGIFTMTEGTTIFPEYIIYRDTPECKGRCDGACSITCTGDGRKYDSLAGLGGSRGTCVDSNILCNKDDPYRGATNILVHEFTHTIHGYALDKDTQNRIDTAFYAARAAAIWDLKSYAMSTSYEYFAEASGVFFFANHYLSANGGMSNCFSKGYCSNQKDARAWLQYKDPSLFSLLSYTFTDRQPDLEAGLARCVKV